MKIFRQYSPLPHLVFWKMSLFCIFAAVAQRNGAYTLYEALAQRRQNRFVKFRETKSSGLGNAGEKTNCNKAERKSDSSAAFCEPVLKVFSKLIAEYE